MKRGGKTNRSGKVLEYVFEQLTHYGFLQIKGRKIDDTEVKPPRYVHSHSEYRTIYGTTGYHEGYIVSDKQNRNDFIEAFDEPKIRIVVECKFQSTSGSVDEKIPYIFENFIKSDVPNWILVLDGDWWIKNERGKAVVQYAKARAQQLQNDYHKLLVLSRHEFKELVKRAWGTYDGKDGQEASGGIQPRPEPNRDRLVQADFISS